ADRLRPARVPAALRRGDHSVARRFERLADRRLTLAADVGMRCVDVGEAGPDGIADERVVLAGVSEPVRPEPDPRHLDVAEPDRARDRHAARKASALATPRSRPAAAGRSRRRGSPRPATSGPPAGSRFGALLRPLLFRPE